MLKLYEMKKELLFQFLALVILFLSSIFYVEHEGIFLSDSIGFDLLFTLYHLVLFLFVNYFLIPKFFHTKKYLLFFFSLFGTIIFFGIVEEGIIEKILTPDTKGRNDVTWQSLYWFFGEILIPMLTFVTIKFVFDNFAHQQRLEKIEKDKLRDELKLLKSQIQPHVLFNSLNNLYHFALKKSDELPSLILKLSNVLRYVVYEAQEEKVLLAKELAFIEDYVDLQEVQYKGRGVITCAIPNDLSDHGDKIAPFLLIPFIENSFKHSFGTKIKEVFVHISLSIEGKKLTLLVENNYEEESNNKEELIQGGIGLMNVKKRLELIYPNQHQLSLNAFKQHYSVRLTLNLSQ